ncbi:hypothetical protein JIN85_14875, partial [Luteolibacter pohnpeiensis]
MSDFRGSYFVEAEWDGKGDFTPKKITRGEMNDKQKRVINNHYSALKKLLSDPAEHAERMCLGAGIFAKPEYGDIRWKVMIDPRTPESVIEKIAETELYADGSSISFLHPKVSRIEGVIRVADGSIIEAPALTKSGYVDVSENATFTAPALTEVSGSVYVSENATFTAPALTEVSGSVDVSENATFTAPALTEVSGYVYVSENATFT